MMSIALEDAGTGFDALARRVEGGETILVTRNGRPILERAPHKPWGGVDFAAGETFFRAQGIRRTAGCIPDDIDDPVPEDLLIRPLPVP